MENFTCNLIYSSHYSVPFSILESTVMFLHFLTDRSEQSLDPEQTAPDQCLHCLPFRLHVLDSLLYGRATLFKFQDNYSSFSGVRTFRHFTVM